jgi:hypothetical protein
VQRIDLKVNVSCCDGCRRKVMKAMSLKGDEGDEPRDFSSVCVAFVRGCGAALFSP